MRITRIQVVTFLGALALLLSGCWGGLTHTDPSEPIEVTAGQTFALSLPADPSGEYTWKLTQDPDGSVVRLTAARQVRRQYFNLDPNQRVEEFWSFQATGPGEVALPLVLSNEDGNVRETRTYIVQVRAG